MKERTKEEIIRRNIFKISGEEFCRKQAQEFYRCSQLYSEQEKRKHCSEVFQNLLICVDKAHTKTIELIEKVGAKRYPERYQKLQECWENNVVMPKECLETASEFYTMTSVFMLEE